MGVGEDARKDELWLYQKVGSQAREIVHTIDLGVGVDN